MNSKWYFLNRATSSGLPEGVVDGVLLMMFIVDDDITNTDYNYLRGEIMKTIAFNSYNSFVEINVYSKDKCLYPRNGKDILNVLGDKIEKVENLNGNTAWLSGTDLMRAQCSRRVNHVLQWLINYLN